MKFDSIFPKIMNIFCRAIKLPRKSNNKDRCDMLFSVKLFSVHFISKGISNVENVRKALRCRFLVSQKICFHFFNLLPSSAHYTKLHFSTVYLQNSVETRTRIPFYDSRFSKRNNLTIP